MPVVDLETPVVTHPAAAHPITATAHSRVVLIASFPATHQE
jgi:hypothetical protein